MDHRYINLVDFICKIFFLAVGETAFLFQDYIGWSLFGVGFLFETIADLQKTVFRANEKNAGKFITSGLWGISRHPNYFGEIILWFGLYISASSTFRGWQFLSVLSPVIIY